MEVVIGIITVLHYVSFIVKALFLILFSPLIILYFTLKYAIFRFILKRELMKSGMKRSEASMLLRDVKFIMPTKTINRKTKIITQNI
jgi:hypothetical protein